MKWQFQFINIINDKNNKKSWLIQTDRKLEMLMIDFLWTYCARKILMELSFVLLPMWFKNYFRLCIDNLYSNFTEIEIIKLYNTPLMLFVSHIS